jgi:mannose-1-phosphate guanylyltransferase
LRKAVAVAEKGHIATIGIRPTRPETGYGYIQLGPKGEDDAYVVERFIEKPDLAHAEAYLRAGTYLWNAGTFFFPAARILNELATHQTQLMTLLLELEQNPEHLAARYGEAPSISIDYAVMERLPPKTLRVLPGDFGWNDVGSFAALSDLHPKDEAHNVALASEGGAAKTVFVDAHRNIVWSNTKQLVSTAFVSDLIVVATEDAILILPRERAQDVKQVVETLNKSKRSEYL